MSAVTVTEDESIALWEALDLYESVGWMTYTQHPEVLARALAGSTFLAVARDASGHLVGVARAISDDATICYLQDILVRPKYQRDGVGRALLGCVMERFAHVRQTVLITDDEAAQRAFYESLGFTEVADMAPEPLRSFVLLR